MSINVKKILLKAKSLAKKGDAGNAAQLYRSVLDQFPQNQQAIRGLASLDTAGSSANHSGRPKLEGHIEILIRLYNAGELHRALEQGRLLAAQHPNDALIHNLVGATSAGLGENDDAIASFTKAIQLKPDYAEAYGNLGVIFNKANRNNEAVASFNRAIALEPNDADTYYNLGNALRDTGLYEEAADSYAKAIDLRHNHTGALNNLGTVFKELGKVDQAIASYISATELRPDFAEAHNNLGNVFYELGRIEEAIACHAKAINIQPNYANAHRNLGNDFTSLGRLKEAIASYAAALQYNPDDADARARKLHQLAHMCEWAAIQLEETSIPSLGISGSEVDPFAMLPLEDHANRHKMRSELYAKNTYPCQRPRAISRPGAKPERIHIGYFSADFQDHATMYLMAGLFEVHDQKKFSISVFSYGVYRNDDMRQRLRAAVDAFHDVRRLSDRDIAELSRSEGIDIAVDLKGYTNYARTGIFAFRAAPIQINYLGYPGTLGAPFFDYIIADHTVIPEEKRSNYSEQIIYLPHSYQVNDNVREISKSVITRTEAGLPETGFVFCCFNNSYKIGPSEFAIWMRLLQQVENSVLWLLASNEWAEENLRNEAQQKGVLAERIIFAEKTPHAEHLSRHRLADLFLDTFNYNAHTTASDALWGGLPIVTCLGDSFPARVSGSLLRAVGLSELITNSKEEYEQLALHLALNPELLARLTEKLATNRLIKPLFDTELFATHIEAAYQQVYDRYFDGKVPGTITVQQ